MTAQDSVMLPGWETQEPGYELRVMSEGQSEDTGIYQGADFSSLQERANSLGATCIQYEKLVWRKAHATAADVKSFEGESRHTLELLNQFNPPNKEAVNLGFLTFTTPSPILVGTWFFTAGKIQDGDADDTLYFVYEACRAL